MYNNFVFFTALRYFRAKKNEKFVSIISSISLIGITIGVAALIVVMSVMNGFHAELTSNIVGLNGDITITPNSVKVIPNYLETEQRLKKYPFITKNTKLIHGQALALAKKSNSGVIVKGIDLSDLKHKGEITKNILSGSFDDYYGEEAIAVGCELAFNLGLQVGSKLKLIAPNLLSTAFGSMPRAKSYVVQVVFSSGMYDYDAAVVLMPIKAAQIFFSMGENINTIEININNITKAEEYATLLKQDFGNEFHVQSWIQSNQQFLNALEIERVAMFVILSLIIIVAAFNIVSSLFMLVKDKTKDIAILKTIGASNLQIMSVFMLNGMLVGIIGTALGVVLGLLFSYNIESIRQFLEGFSGIKLFDPAIYFLYNLPSVVEISDVIFISTLAFLLSFLATIYPAYKASSLNPIEAMRYE